MRTAGVEAGRGTGVEARCQQGTEEPRGELWAAAMRNHRNQPSTSIRKEPRGRVRVVGHAKTQEPRDRNRVPVTGKDLGAECGGETRAEALVPSGTVGREPRGRVHVAGPGREEQ